VEKDQQVVLSEGETETFPEISYSANKIMKVYESLR
jgi:hypothetical protein